MKKFLTNIIIANESIRHKFNCITEIYISFNYFLFNETCKLK
jgi:hypothetical protein